MKGSLKKGAGNLFLVALLVFLGIADVVGQSFFRAREWGMENNGISFGVGQGINEGLLWLVLLFVLAVLVRNGIKDRQINVPLFLVAIGGGVNLWGRVLTGGVWDYLKLPFFDLWFNFSDVMITIGVLLAILGK